MFTIDALASLTTGESLLFVPTPLDVHKFLLHAYDRRTSQIIVPFIGTCSHEWPYYYVSAHAYI